MTLKYIYKKLLVVYNKKSRNYLEEQSDFFSQNEFDFIVSLAKQSQIDIEFIEGELRFIDTINYYFPDEIVVLNLTRRGTAQNKKSSVTAICDLKKIPVIGSSVLTMNLCRNKTYLSPLLNSRGITNPTSITSMNQLELDEYYIIKENASSGSLGLTSSAIKKAIDITEHMISTYTVQKYISGYEIEVPFIIVNNVVKILDVFKIVIEGTDYYTPTNIGLLDYEHSDNFNYDLIKLDLNYDIMQALNVIITECVDLLDIHSYGRIDFRVSDLNDINTFYIFDIATSPFFTENTSFLKGCKENVFDLLFSTLEI